MWRHFVALADEWVVTEGAPYADGGVDTFWAGGSPVKRWEAAWDGLTVAERAIAEAFVTSVKGTHLTFNMTWRDSTVYVVKLESYEAGHEDRPSGYYTGHFCKFRMVKRP
jgi:hypothetical protein